MAETAAATAGAAAASAAVAGAVGAPGVVAAVPGVIGTLGVPAAAGALPATTATLALVLSGITASVLVPALAQAVQVFPPAITQANSAIAAMSVIYVQRKLTDAHKYFLLPI